MNESPQRAFVSYGGGVQSTAIALLAINRDRRLLEVTGGLVPELYIFADVGDEPEALYPHLREMEVRIRESGARYVEVRTPLGDLGEHVMHAAVNGHRRAEHLPYWVRTRGKPAGHTRRTQSGYDLAPTRRNCTREFKIKPLLRFARSHFGARHKDIFGGGAVPMWLGISEDELAREKCGPVPKCEWAIYRNPLIEMGWTRADCESYIIEHGLTPQRSACVFCPFHSMAEWRRIRACPADWAKALKMDEALEQVPVTGAFGFKGPIFLNREGVRLRDLDLTISDDPEQVLMDNECAGVCGV